MQLARLRVFNVRNNPLELPPLSVAEKGMPAIFSYLHEISTGEKVEAKSCSLVLKDATQVPRSGSAVSLVVNANTESGKRAFLTRFVALKLMLCMSSGVKVHCRATVGRCFGYNVIGMPADAHRAGMLFGTSYAARSVVAADFLG